jgi:hypothetical protein
MPAGEALKALTGLIRLWRNLLPRSNKLAMRVFRGQQALNRAHNILWPKKIGSIIDAAISEGDADFIEKCVLSAFESSDPVYIVGVDYYTTRKKISDICRELQQLAPWLSVDDARWRVRWCLQIFQAKVFLVARSQLKSES